MSALLRPNRAVVMTHVNLAYVLDRPCQPSILSWPAVKPRVQQRRHLYSDKSAKRYIDKAYMQSAARTSSIQEPVCETCAIRQELVRNFLVTSPLTQRGVTSEGLGAGCGSGLVRPCHFSSRVVGWRLTLAGDRQMMAIRMS